MKIGIDVTKVSRIQSAAEKTDGFLKRVFTENEIAYFSKNKMKWESAAANFAAKEAFAKYLGTGIRDLSLLDIELFHDELGAPYLLFKGERVDADVSLTHDGGIAVAVVCGSGKRSRIHSDYIKSLIPKRADDAHKGQCGRVFILAGSKGMTGAAALSAAGALRSGAGLVTVGTAEEEQKVLAVKLTEAMTVGYASTLGSMRLSDKEKIKTAAEGADAFVIGPGLGRRSYTAELVLWLIENVNAPMVIDADGLNALSGNIDILKKRKRETILTPHEGEMALLCGKTAAEVKAERVKTAKEFSETFGVTLVLKGAGTVVCGGGEVFINPTGNSGMATGGSGDVLSGIIGSFLAQGLSSYEAAALGAYVHGLAGDMAAEDKGKPGLIAGDIAENIPYAVKEILGED